MSERPNPEPNTSAQGDIVGGDKITIGEIVGSNIAIGRGARVEVYNHPLPPAEQRLRRDLTILLRNVETAWVKGALENSVHDAALLDLGKDVRSEAVDHPWEIVLGKPDEPDEELPAGTRISDIFAETPLLLILGEPGSGKTITLIELARALIAQVRADENFTQAVPVIFNLSTWTRSQSLYDWAIEELRSKYRVPRRDGRKWLEQKRILPLLDGLDEVRLADRNACVEAINQFAVDYGLQGMVVCSRIKDYTALDARLQFYGAIYIRPLEDEQIQGYLAEAGGRLDALRDTLQEDEDLQALARTPLMLNVMSLAYADASAKDLQQVEAVTLEKRRSHIFARYVGQMFRRRGQSKPFSDEQTIDWLSWLARNMQRHNQEVFLIEGFQPSWLASRRWQWTYLLLSRLIGGLIVGLINSNELMSGLNKGWIIGLSIGFIDVLRFEWLDKWTVVRKLPIFLWASVNVLIVGLMIGLIGGPMNGLVAGLIFGVRGSRQSLINDVQTVEALHWSWLKALKGWLIAGLVVGSFCGLFYWLESWQLDELLAGLMTGPLIGVVFGVLAGLRPKLVETKTTSNQGVWLSARNAIFGGLVVLLIFGLSVVLIFWLIARQFEEIYEMIFPLLMIGLISTLWYGGLDVIQHFTLRLILLIRGNTPRNYARFLDYAVERVFLQKVGGGYRFIHRLLLEHFADMVDRK